MLYIFKLHISHLLETWYLITGW